MSFSIKCSIIVNFLYFVVIDSLPLSMLRFSTQWLTLHLHHAMTFGFRLYHALMCSTYTNSFVRSDIQFPNCWINNFAQRPFVWNCNISIHQLMSIWLDLFFTSLLIINQFSCAINDLRIQFLHACMRFNCLSIFAKIVTWDILILRLPNGHNRYQPIEAARWWGVWEWSYWSHSDETCLSLFYWVRLHSEKWACPRMPPTLGQINCQLSIFHYAKRHSFMSFTMRTISHRVSALSQTKNAHSDTTKRICMKWLEAAKM